MDSHRGKRPGHAAPGLEDRRDARHPSGVPRVPAPPPRVVHLGSHAARGRPARGDPGIPAGKRRPQGGSLMAIVNIPSEHKTLRERAEVAAFLGTHAIEYERWTPAHPVSADAPAEAVLAAYATEIETLKKRGGYATADVIDVKPDTPNLDVMLAKFSREHWHDE